MKGRGTTVISVRLPDKVVAMLAERANRQDISIGEYIKQQILKSCSVNTIPLYNPGIHRAGDKVLIKKGNGLVEAIVPELDLDGRPIPGAL